MSDIRAWALDNDDYLRLTGTKTGSGATEHFGLDVNITGGSGLTVTATVDESTLATSANQVAGTKVIDKDGTNKLVVNSDGSINVDYGALTSATDSVSQLPLISTIKTLQSAATTGNGTAITIGQYSNINISIISTAAVATATVTFQISDNSDNFTDVSAIRLSDFSVATNTTTVIGGTSEKWIIPIAGYKEIRVVLSGVTGATGTVTVIGTLVA